MTVKPTAPQKKTAQAPVMTPERQKKLDYLCSALDQLLEDTSVPRNIRRGAESAKKVLTDASAALDVRKSSATNILDDLANDPNIPVHGRTMIYMIMSRLEQLS